MLQVLPRLRCKLGESVPGSGRAVLPMALTTGQGSLLQEI